MLLLCIFFIHIGSASEYLEDGKEITSEKLIDTMNNTSNLSMNPFIIQFFYNTHCGSCQEAMDYLKVFITKHPDIDIQYHDLYNSSTNNTLYDQYKTQFGNNVNIRYPSIFIGDVVIEGSNDIAL